MGCVPAAWTDTDDRWHGRGRSDAHPCAAGCAIVLMFPRPTRATWGLLLANAAGFLLQAVAPQLAVPLMLWPLDVGSDAPGVPRPDFMPWQLLTSAFLHADAGHLLFNMLALWMFGAMPQQVWNEKRFLTYYMVCVLAAGLCQLVVASVSVAQGGPAIPTLGASGGVYGLVLAFGMLFPTQRMLLFPIPVPITARTVAILFAVMSLLFGMLGSRGGVAHFAYLGGMLGGWLLIRHWRRRGGGPRGGSGGRKPAPRHLKVVK